MHIVSMFRLSIFETLFSVTGVHLLRFLYARYVQVNPTLLKETNRRWLNRIYIYIYIYQYTAM